MFRGVGDREGFDSALRELFDIHARAGVIELPYHAVALVFGLAEGPG